MTRLRSSAAAVFSTAALAISLPASPVQAMPAPDTATGQERCIEPKHADEGARSGDARPHGDDHRDVSVRQQRAIEQRTKEILNRDGVTSSEVSTLSAGIPVYVHVMMDAKGNGNVTNQQIADQVAVLNKTFGGQESTSAANTGFTFNLAGTDRFYNTQWHNDRQSSSYRTKTRQGGANALNIWLVNFDYLGIATFPWDYARNPGVDGIRVHYNSLPGGGIANYNLGETATHEAGHWLGLYHTFQGGCTTTNDEVADTPAQGSSTNGCPEGRDSCSLAGLDPIHNYMDYSFDSCYTQFTPNQSTRMSSMFSAYRS